MVELALRISTVLEELFELGDESVGLSEVQGSKISKEWFVDEVIVDVEEESVGLVLGRVLVRDPVELFLDDFNRSGVEGLIHI